METAVVNAGQDREHLERLESAEPLVTLSNHLNSLRFFISEEDVDYHHSEVDYHHSCYSYDNDSANDDNYDDDNDDMPALEDMSNIPDDDDEGVYKVIVNCMPAHVKTIYLNAKAKEAVPDNCPVCLEPFDFEDHKSIWVTMCGHLLHTTCLYERPIRTQNQCVVCRADYKA